MARIRTFIAVDVGGEIRDNAINLQESLARSGAVVKWVSPESLHITVLFLGEVEDRHLHSVCRVVQETAARLSPFALRVSGVGAFPNTRRPKVAWVGVVEGAEQLRELHTALDDKLFELGSYRREEREFTPHLTLGRVKTEADGFMLAPELTQRTAWEGGKTLVDEVVVYSSMLERDGPEYTIMSRGVLGGKRR